MSKTLDEKIKDAIVNHDSFGIDIFEAIAEIKKAVLQELPEPKDERCERFEYRSSYNDALTDIKNKLQ